MRKKKNGTTKKLEEYSGDSFLEKYKDVIVTYEIIENDKDFCLADVPDDHKYKCHLCESIITFGETTRCDICDMYSCNDCCSKSRFFKCGDENCYYCRRGHCYNNKMVSYCNDCYENPYEKYESTIMTYEMFDNDSNRDEMYTYDDEAKECKYECPICQNVITFNDTIECDKCGKYVCRACYNHNYMGCGNENCKYCRTYDCYDAIIKNICIKCCPYHNNSDKNDLVDKIKLMSYENMDIRVFTKLQDLIVTGRIILEREYELITKLHEIGCEFRKDSKLCEQYILFGNLDCSYVVQTMAEMKFYFNETTYSKEYKKEKNKYINNNEYYDTEEISKNAKYTALKKWCNKYKSYNDAVKCEKLPISLCEEIKKILTKRNSL